jgi:hypothetical protein
MIQLEIEPEVEQRIVEAARARGLEPSVYAREILTSAIGAREQEEASANDLLRGLQSLSENATAVSNYPADFFTREVIYGDHD